MDKNNQIAHNVTEQTKYQCLMAASCTHHIPAIISQLLNKSHTPVQLVQLISGLNGNQ